MPSIEFWYKQKDFYLSQMERLSELYDAEMLTQSEFNQEYLAAQISYEECEQVIIKMELEP